MAYRFLLEVPEPMVAEATIAVDRVGDAQVILARSAHGLGVDQAYMDLTVAAHTLRVIESIYDWFGEVGASRPDIRLVLHGGERISLESTERGRMVAAIRNDQPWVERSLPKIGEHEREGVPDMDPSLFDMSLAIDSAGANAPGLLGDRLATTAGTLTIGTQRSVELLALNHLTIRVNNLSRAEAFYGGFFSMELLGRATRTPNGGFEPVPLDYTWEEARRRGAAANVTFLRSPAFTLAVEGVGMAERMNRQAILGHISVGVDGIGFATLRAEVLVRNLEVLLSTDTAMIFRDPFGVTWEVTAQGTPDLGL